MFRIPYYLKIHNPKALNFRIEMLCKEKFKNKMDAYYKIRVALDIPTAVYKNKKWHYPKSSTILELLEEGCIIIGKPEYYEAIYLTIP